jgi:hypothetical protein
MSKLLIQKYLNDLSDLKKVSGSHRESVVREAFKTLLKDWGKGEGLLFIPEYEHTTAMDERRYVDGALVEPQLRLPVGYWEAKDTKDDLDAEIAKKFRRGYPQDNIIFEDTETAVLIQNRREVLRCPVADPEQIRQLIGQFFKFEPEVIREFRKAVEKFREDLPAVLETLRKAIDKAEGENAAFKKAAVKFLKHAQETINPSVTAADVREMLIQHILTEEIFSQVFDNTDFHHNNNVAKELYALEETFFTGGVKRETIERLSKSSRLSNPSFFKTVPSFASPRYPSATPSPYSSRSVRTSVSLRLRRISPSASRIRLSRPFRKCFVIVFSSNFARRVRCERARLCRTVPPLRIEYSKALRDCGEEGNSGRTEAPRGERHFGRYDFRWRIGTHHLFARPQQSRL